MVDCLSTSVRDNIPCGISSTNNTLFACTNCILSTAGATKEDKLYFVVQKAISHIFSITPCRNNNTKTLFNTK